MFEAFSQKKRLHIKDMALMSEGDLEWNGKATFGEKYQLTEEAEKWFSPDTESEIQVLGVHPGDRHPILMCEPIFMKDYQIKKDEEKLLLNHGDEPGVSPTTIFSQFKRLLLNQGDEPSLPVAMERVSLISELTENIVAKSSQMFGLLRFDAGQWSVQPLGVISGKGKKAGEIFTGMGAATIIKKQSKTSTVAILRERAGRLLRG